MQIKQKRNRAMTKTNEDEKPDIKPRQSRKFNTVWSKEKIAHLIQLYKQHECLWNHYTEAYKHKEKRAKAIETICGELQITKFDFGKKIHNLRNQFNSEMKKLERRIEESGGNASDPGQRCRWEHYESLCFLKNIIEPRPGFQTGSHVQPKRLCLKYDYKSEEDAADHYVARIENATTTNASIEDVDEVTEYFEEATADDDDDTIDTFEEPIEETRCISTKKENSKRSSSPSIATSTHEIVTIPTQTKQTRTYLKRISSTQVQSQHQQTIKSTPTIEEHVFNLTSTPITTTITNRTQSPSNAVQSPGCNRFWSTPQRDQWDAFGELVATEFRNLSSEASRRKLKRKIMQAMLEIGDEDDSICLNVTVH